MTNSASQTAKESAASPRLQDLKIGVIGGTGPQGCGLAKRWAQAGLNVTVGSRRAEQAQTTAEEIRALLPDCQISGASNAAVAESCDVVAIVVPWDAHKDTVLSLKEHLKGKLVIDCVNPLGFDKRGAYVLPVAEGSATEQAAMLLPESRVVGAFHSVSAVVLADLDSLVDCDVLVLGENREDTDIVQRLADAVAGARGVYAGRLRNSSQIEALTANLISINRRYKTHAGVRISGL